MSLTRASPVMSPSLAVLRIPQHRCVKVCATKSSVVDDVKRMAVVGVSSCLVSWGAASNMMAMADVCPSMVTASSGDAAGLQYCDIKEGEGESPVKGAFIKVHYEGKLDSDIASGTFDSSYDRGRPLGFSIGTGQVIRGWDLGILGDGDSIPAMKPGGKRKLVIPSELGYGSRGAGNVIPPNATLYFDVEYLGRLGRK